MVVRLVVEALHAAAAGEHNLGPRHDGSLAVEAVLVVEEFSAQSRPRMQMFSFKSRRVRNRSAPAWSHRLPMKP